MPDNYSSTQPSSLAAQVSKPKSHLFLRLKRKFLSHVWFARLSLLVGSLALFYLLVVLVNFGVNKIGIKNYASYLGDFIFAPQSKVKSFEGRTNILVLGKGGPGHTGEEATDTMIFVSIALQKPSVVMISIPRDIWVPAIRAKINSAYYWGNQKQSGGGLVLAKSLTEEIIGKQISYAVVVDFGGFTKIIDVVGGIDVNVENSFVDEKFPIEGKEDDPCGGDPLFRCRYETVRFEKGTTHMDGITALKFVRSRYSTSDEGTDLARDKRQEKVLLALRQKVLSPQIYLSPRKVLAIWRVVRESTETDISLNAAAVLVRKALSSKKALKSYVISDEFIVHPPVSPRYDRQWVFIPKDEDWSWSGLKNWINQLLTK